MTPSVRRKLTLQLTPLLDLLLIVFFAQYMELQRLTAEAQTRSREQASSAEEARRELADERRALEEKASRLSGRASEAEEQRRVIGELAAELFRVPPELAGQLLQPQPGTVLTPEEVGALRARLRRFGEMQADELVRHLLTYNELLKRADVWDLYIDADGVVTFDTGERSFTFRASSPEDFAAALFQRYKALPQPKGLVIMLLSYGDITEVRAQAARNGLRMAAERMRDDSDRRSQFEYAILGLRSRT